MIKRLAAISQPDSLASLRQVRVRASTETLGRDNLVLKTDGIDLRNYRKNPVILWQHDPTAPIARAADCSVSNSDLNVLCQFPPQNASPKADEIFELIRCGIVNAASIGFDIAGQAPLNAGRPRDGTVITKCELHEISFVSIPAVPDALVTERQHRGDAMASFRALAARYERDMAADRKRQAAGYARELAASGGLKKAKPGAKRAVKRSIAEHRAKARMCAAALLRLP